MGSSSQREVARENCIGWLSGLSAQPQHDAASEEKTMARPPRRNHSPEFKARAAVSAIKGEKTLIEEFWHREGIAASMFYGWPQEFLEAGRRPLARDIACAATTGEVKEFRPQANALKNVVADLTSRTAC